MDDAKTKMFTKIHPQKTYMEVAQRIVDHIRLGDLKPGDCIPPEIKLAQMMGVSRSSVREALSALKLSGLIASRPGYGNYICELPEAGSTETLMRLNELVEEQENPFEILEARECVEPKIAYFAAERANETDLEKIDALINKMASSDCTDEELLSLDSEFHIALAMASHSDILLGIVKYLFERMSNSSWPDFKQKNLYSKNRKSLSVEEHKEIYEAIRMREPFLAKSHMHLHLERTKNTMLSGALSTKK